MGKHTIFGVHITDRVKKATEVQEVFTKYGCNIRTRVGLHDASENVCAPNGVILLEMVGDEHICNEMADSLKAIAGVEVQKMSFK